MANGYEGFGNGDVTLLKVTEQGIGVRIGGSKSGGRGGIAAEAYGYKDDGE